MLLIVCTLYSRLFHSKALVGRAPVSLHLLDFYWTHLVWQSPNGYEFQQASRPEHLPLSALGPRLREMKPRCMASGDGPARPLPTLCTGKFIPNLQQRHLAPFLFQRISYIISLHVLARIPQLWRILSPLIRLKNISAIYKRTVGRTRCICAWIVCTRIVAVNRAMHSPKGRI